MCFVKKTVMPSIAASVEPEPIVQRHQADADLTKTKQDSVSSSLTYKTQPIGLEDETNKKTKTLLGE